MKLLGWMHRKFRQNSTEPLKDFHFGRPSFDEQQYYPRSSNGTKFLGKAQRDNYLRNSFASLEAARAEEEDFEEESSAEISELFHGFLTIGTLGLETAIAGSSTPTFTISVENITEKETEITENELKVINDELEKVLWAEGKEDSCYESSGRNSHVSAGRSSHGSTITLGGKSIEGSETSGNGQMVCPLQGYLLGSAIELPETTAAKKEHRTSLGELFQRTKSTEELYGEKRAEKETDKSAVHLMKKMLKRRMLHASSRSSNAVTGGNIDSASTETKLHKILHMFHKKVHPESLTASQKADKTHKKEKKSNITYEVGYNNEEQTLSDEDIVIVPRRVLPKDGIQCFKSQYNPPKVRLSGRDSTGNKECWIKTDSDYLVLEL